MFQALVKSLVLMRRTHDPIRTVLAEVVAAPARVAQCHDLLALLHRREQLQCFEELSGPRDQAPQAPRVE